MKSNRIQELDALRGIAALLVVLFHYTMNREESALGFKLGTTGVDLFFIISGFVILMSLAKIDTAKRFIINRVSRLYPSYWAAVTITYLVSLYINSIQTNLWMPNWEFYDYLANLTMFQLYLGIPNIDGPYWTMPLEMLFYLLMIGLFLSKKLNQFHLTGAVLIITIALVNFFWGTTLFVQELFDTIPLIPFLPLFYAGTLFYKLFCKPKERYLILLIFLSYLVQIYLFEVAGRSHHSISQFEYGMMLTIYYSLFFLFINGRLKFIVHPITLFLGSISYALYLIHQSLSIEIIIPYFTTQYNMNFWIAALFIALPVSILLAFSITQFIEKSFGKWMKNKLSNSLLKKNNTLKTSIILIILPILLFSALMIFNPNNGSIIRKSIAGPEFISKNTYLNNMDNSTIQFNLPEDEKYFSGWENIEYTWDPEDSIPVIKTLSSELFGATYKTKNLPTLEKQGNKLFIHTRIKQSCLPDANIYMVVSLVQQKNEVLLYQALNLTDKAKNKGWNNFYIVTELPFVNKEDYEFVIHLFNSEKCDFSMSELDFFIVNEKN